MKVINFDNTNNKKINASTKRFKAIAASGKPKGLFLANWLLTKSYHLENEINQKNPSYFNEYKKGNIVMVDFGVNIGNELSNRHLGIVLNKDDNKRSGVLTVLPVSSKYSKHYLKLDDELFKTIVHDLRLKRDAIEREASEIGTLISDTNDIVDGEKKTITITSDQNQEEVTDDVTRIVEYLINKNQLLKSNSDKLIKVLERYEKYNKDSFVCIKSIQTVSKLRIITINDMDPSGTIRLSKNTMDKIDKELIRVYTDVKNIE